MGRRRSSQEDSWMPKHVHRGKSAYEWRPARGLCIRLCALTATDAEVISAHARAISEGTTSPRSASYSGWNELYRVAAKSAKTRGKEFLLPKGEFMAIVSRAGGRCEVSGIEFSAKKIPGAMRRPWVPSLDRIDSRKPYTANNCRLVCAAANVAINEWGDEVFRHLLRNMLKSGFMQQPADNAPS